MVLEKTIGVNFSRVWWGCKHLALGLLCLATKSFKGYRGWGCALDCRHLALGLHALGVRARPTCLAADPRKRVCKTTYMWYAESCTWVWRPPRWVRTSTLRVCKPVPLGPNLLVMDLKLMDLTSRLNSLGCGIRTQG